MLQTIYNKIRIFFLPLSLFDKVKLFLYSFLINYNLKLLADSSPLRLFFKRKIPIYISNKIDMWTFFEIFLYKEYDFEASFDVKRVLDLGGNVGYTSLFFLDKFSTCEVITVEADDVNVEKIKSNLAFFKDRFFVEHYAIARNNEPILFYKNFNKSISGSIIQRDMSADGVLVETITFQDLEFKYGKFDIVKFDIEGGEWDLFNHDLGLQSLPLIIIGEYHEDLIERPVADFIKKFVTYKCFKKKISKKRYLLTFVKK